ncbi:FHA domain-containing protein [Comamonas odontotermitis]|uniref:FHA domain-containing protein n=1 Tax=Comamonas odontotermitis TaxID=379895 RepID=A0ABR6RI11_9BURK|nr:type VI secretion system-associated FHA domain protein TagH [Comamonas odontotermitis]MBB6578808.1 FHA domain-containing protein [Comamonas odontotermitis]
MFLQLRANVVYANGTENIVQHVFDSQGGTIGRDTHCQMVLQDPFRRISRIQAQIVFDSGLFSLINASTSNPIYVDGQELSPGETCAIHSGSSWQTGNYTITVEHVGEAQPVDQRPLQSQPAKQPDVAPAASLLPSHVPRGPFDDLLGEPVQAPSEQASRDEGLVHSTAALSPFSAPLAATAIQEPAPMQPSVALHQLGADPFADLLATPLSNQVASAPVRLHTGDATNPLQGRSLIPDDFNPLALQGISPRNTADPLAYVQDEQSIQEMFPGRSVDAIFHPGEGNIGELIQDPLNASQNQALVDANIHLDPLELFAKQGSQDRLDPSVLFQERTTQPRSVSDHRVEVGSFFRAPRAFDPSQEKSSAEPARGDVLAPLPEQSQPYSPTPASNAEVHREDSLESLFNIDSAPIESIDLGLHTIASTEAPSDRASDKPRHVDQKEMEHSATSVRSDAEATPLAALPQPVPQAAVVEIAPADAASDRAPLPAKAGSSGNDTPSKDSEHSAADLLNSFKAGAGLSDCKYPENLTPEFMHMVGQMLGASVQGCMDLLSSRAAAKQEVRVSVTLINAEANNPLKFLPAGPSALAQIFGPRMPGFQAGPAAIDSAFQDLRAHEMAMMAGIQAAVRGLFDRFDPVHLEEQLQALGKSKALFSSQKNARLWELYCSRYEWLKDEMKNQSPAAWGTEFLSAYQAEVSQNREGNIA